MALDLESLEKSIAALGRALAFASKVEGKDQETAEVARNSVIQCFEVAYEQGWKFMQRWIEENVSPDLVRGVPKRELYRHAFEQDLIKDVDEWMRYHGARNETSHTYDLEKAEGVFRVAGDFHNEIRLNTRNCG
jgi:nucleotidyltransferase substrate binding protein (TIGR01987 family)